MSCVRAGAEALGLAAARADPVGEVVKTPANSLPGPLMDEPECLAPASRASCFKTKIDRRNSPSLFEHWSRCFTHRKCAATHIALEASPLEWFDKVSTAWRTSTTLGLEETAVFFGVIGFVGEITGSAFAACSFAAEAASLSAFSLASAASFSLSALDSAAALIASALSCIARAAHFSHSGTIVMDTGSEFASSDSSSATRFVNDTTCAWSASSAFEASSECVDMIADRGEYQPGREGSQRCRGRQCRNTKSQGPTEQEIRHAYELSSYKFQYFTLNSKVKVPRQLVRN